MRKTIRFAIGLVVASCGGEPALTIDAGGAPSDGVHVTADAATVTDLAAATDFAASTADLWTSKRVFATTSHYNGNLGGLAGADSLCASDAAAMGFGGATWVAWLSTSGVNAIDRVVGDGPWRRADGTIVFADRSGLLSFPVAPIVPGAVVFSWTGTQLGGTRTAYNCANWTSSNSSDTASYGLFAINAGSWGENWNDLVISQQHCDDMSSGLLCFEN